MEHQLDEIKSELVLISTLLQKIVDNTDKIRENTENVNNICDEMHRDWIIKDK